MEFLTDNYIWIIMAVVVVLMTIIGYVAEKTDFGKKEFSKRKKKGTKSEKNKKEAVIEENKEVQEPINMVEQKPEVLSNSERLQEELSAPLVNEQVLEQQMFDDHATISFKQPYVNDTKVLNESYEEPKQTFTEDLNVPLEQISSNQEQTTSLEEDLNAPFGDHYFASEENTNENITPLPNETLSNTFFNENLNVPFGDNKIEKDDFDLDLPDIDSIKEEVNTANNVDDDDDIWKF